MGFLDQIGNGIGSAANRLGNLIPRAQAQTQTPIIPPIKISSNTLGQPLQANAVTQQNAGNPMTADQINAMFSPNTFAPTQGQGGIQANDQGQQSPTYKYPLYEYPNLDNYSHDLGYTSPVGNAANPQEGVSSLGDFKTPSGYRYNVDLVNSEIPQEGDVIPGSPIYPGQWGNSRTDTQYDAQGNVAAYPTYWNFGEPIGQTDQFGKLIPPSQGGAPEVINPGYGGTGRGQGTNDIPQKINYGMPGSPFPPGSYHPDQTQGGLPTWENGPPHVTGAPNANFDLNGKPLGALLPSDYSPVNQIAPGVYLNDLGQRYQGANSGFTDLMNYDPTNTPETPKIPRIKIHIYPDNWSYKDYQNMPDYLPPTDDPIVKEIMNDVQNNSKAASTSKAYELDFTPPNFDASKWFQQNNNSNNLNAAGDPFKQMAANNGKSIAKGNVLQKMA